MDLYKVFGSIRLKRRWPLKCPCEALRARLTRENLNLALWCVYRHKLKLGLRPIESVPRRTLLRRVSFPEKLVSPVYEAFADDMQLGAGKDDSGFSFWF